MAAAEREARAFLRLHGEDFKRGLKEARRQMTDFRKGANAEIRKVAIAVAALGVATAAIGAGFEQQKATIQAVSGASRAEMAALEVQSRSLGATTEHTAKQAAEGQENLFRAGFRTNEVLLMMQGNLALASAGQEEIGFAAELSAGYLKAFNLEADQTNRVVNLLQASTAASRLDLRKLDLALRSGASAAAGWGIALEETVAVTGALTDIMGVGSRAGTSLKAILAELGRTAGDQSNAVGAALANWRAGVHGIIGAVQQLEAAGLTTEQILKSMGTEAGPALAILFDRGSESLLQLEQRITGTNAAFEAQRIQMNTLQGDLKTLNSALQELALRVFDQMKGPLREAVQTATQVLQQNYDKITRATEDILDAILKVMEVAGDAFSFVRTHSEAFEGLAIAVGAATASAYALATAIGVVSAAMAISPVTWLAVAIGALVGAFALVISKTIGWRVAWINLSSTFQGAMVLLKRELELARIELNLAFEIIRKLPVIFDEALKTSWQLIQWFGKLVLSSFAELWKAIRAALKGENPLDGLANFFEVEWEEMVKIAQAGRLDEIFVPLLEAADTASVLAKERAAKLLDEILQEAKARKAALQNTVAEAAGGGGSVGEVPPNEIPPEVQAASQAEELKRQIYVRGLEEHRERADAMVAIEESGLNTRLQNHRVFASSVGTMASALYSGIRQEAAKTASFEALQKLQLGKLFARAAGEMAAVELETRGKMAVTRAGWESAEALAAIARYDGFAAAKHTASAVKFLALAGGAAIGANIARNIGTSSANQFDTGFGGAAFDGGGGVGTGAGSGSGNIRLTGRGGPETVNVFVNTNIYGDVLGNIDDVIEEKIVPRFRDLFLGDALAVG